MRFEISNSSRVESSFFLAIPIPRYVFVHYVDICGTKYKHQLQLEICAFKFHSFAAVNQGKVPNSSFCHKKSEKSFNLFKFIFFDLDNFILTPYVSNFS